MTITMNNQRIDELFNTDEAFRVTGSPETVLRWARHLRPDERVLVELIVRNRLTRQQASEIMGVHNGTITRRLQRISQRLFSPIGLALVDDQCSLPEPYRTIGLAHILRKEHLNKIARRTGMRLSDVRQAITYVKGWHRGAVVPTLRPGEDAR